MKDSVYIIFDQLPTKQSGGGTAKTYADFINEFDDELDIKLISIFGYKGTDYQEFSSHAVIEVTKKYIDIKFVNAFLYLKNKQFKKFFFAIYSAFFFFLFIPISRIKTRHLLLNKNVIVSAPAAAIFLSKKINFILEIHTRFEYFWGDNLFGHLQSLLMAKPSLTIFRSKSDQKKAMRKMNADYIYNSCNDSRKNSLIDKDPSLFNKAIFVGRLDNPCKNPMMLIDCAEIVKKSVKDFTLDIYGDGVLCNDLRKKIIERKLEDTVFLRGYMHDKATYYNYGMLWLTSICEGLPLVIIEAKAYGLPVATTIWGDAVHELVNDESDGIIAENAEVFAAKVIDLIKDKGKMERFSEAAYQDYLNRFNKKTHTQRWKEIMQKQFNISF